MVKKGRTERSDFWQRSVRFYNFKIKTNDFEVFYPALKSIGKDISKLTLNLDVSNSVVTLSDLACFIPQLSDVNFPLDVTLKASGTLNKLNLSNLNVKSTDDKIKVEVKGYASDIYSLDSIFVDVPKLYISARSNEIVNLLDVKINNRQEALGKLKKKILVINGPNLNMLGLRDPKHYGTLTLDEINNMIKEETAFDFEFYQSNHEGAIVDKLQEYKKYDGIIINPAAYTHTSVAIHDALEIVDIVKVEVHLSKVDSREDFRKINFIRDVVDETFQGDGALSYIKAVRYLKNKLNVR